MLIQQNHVQNIGERVARIPAKQGLAQKPDMASVEAAIRGVPGSFTDLCRRYYPAMVAIAHSVLGDPPKAERCSPAGLCKGRCKIAVVERVNFPNGVQPSAEMLQKIQFINTIQGFKMTFVPRQEDKAGLFCSVFFVRAGLLGAFA